MQIANSKIQNWEKEKFRKCVDLKVEMKKSTFAEASADKKKYLSLPAFKGFL
jgi:hypothetical protein